MPPKPLVGLKGLLNNGKPSPPESDASAKPDRPKRKAAQNAIDNSVWYAAEHKKRPASDKLEEPPSNKAKTSSRPRIRKSSQVVPVSSDDDSDEETPQGESKSNKSGSEDTEADSTAQYVPPCRRLVRNLAPGQDFAGSPRSSSPDSQSLPPGTDIDDASSLFNDNATNEEEGGDVDGTQNTRGTHVHSSTQTRTMPPSKRSRESDSKLKQSSRRAQGYAEEVPKFKPHALKSDEKPAAAAPRVWSPHLEYKAPGVGQRLISLHAQPAKIQEVLGKAVTTAIDLFLIQDAYPDVGLWDSMLQDALVSVAMEVGLKELAERLCEPEECKWRKFLSDYVFNCVVHVCSDVKKHAESIVLDSGYPITGRLCDVPCYVSFITLKLKYIFPLKAPPPPQYDEVVVPPTILPTEGAETPPIVTKRVERPYVPNYTKDDSLEL